MAATGLAGFSAGLASSGAIGTLTEIITVAEEGKTVLDDAAKLSCDGQTAANAAAELATRTGHVKAAKIAGELSKLLGYGCTWL